VFAPRDIEMGGGIKAAEKELAMDIFKAVDRGVHHLQHNLGHSFVRKVQDMA
jgi:hypothetical protein